MADSGGLNQHRGDVELRLDGDAYAWAWTPNVNASEDRLEIDLLPDLASLCHAGRGRRVEPPGVHDNGLAVLVSVHLGAHGTATIGGQPVSEAALSNLASAGLMVMIRSGMDAESDSDASSA